MQRQRERAAASEPRERSAPANRRARERVGESEGRSPSDETVKITVFDNDRVLARTLAVQIAASLGQRPAIVLGLATGRTPIRLYHELGTLHAHGQADFSRATTFNLDEFAGIRSDHPGSFRVFMHEHLFSRVNVPPDQIHFLNGAAPDPAAECERYEAAIAVAGGIDLQILGIGTNGHIGFNEPARALAPRTHLVTLKASTRRSNAMLFEGDPAKVPTHALSMGMATILHARRIVMIATGKSKARCVERMVRGRIETRLPASFLQLHGNVELVLDRAAASALPGQA
jgi:glucosamine-6-phosphate deaminase